MKTLLFIILCTSPLVCLSQEKTYDAALSYGAFTSPTFKQQKARNYFSADFDYHLSGRWTVSSGLMTGQFSYFDDIRSNAPTAITYPQDDTNARGYQLYGYGMAKFSIVKTEAFNLQVGVGVGFFNQRLEYPYQETYTTGSSISFAQSSFTDLALPISLEAYYLLGKRIGIGLKVGAYIEPDFPLVGAHIGPQLRVRL